MTSDEINRLTVIGDLLEIAKPLDEVAAQLTALEWDYEGDGLELTRRHLSTALRRYLEATLSARDVETWANLIEGREDIFFEDTYERLIEKVVYELANPTLTQSLDRNRASALLEALA